MHALNPALRLALWLGEVLTRNRAARRRAAYTALYVLAMLVAIPFMEPVKHWNWQVLTLLDPRGPPWPDRLELLDLDWDLDPAKLPEARAKLAQALKALAKLKDPPNIVVIDMSISTLPIEIECLRQALDALRANGVTVFQAVDLEGFAPGLDYETVLNYQGREALHGRWGVRYGHTLFAYSGVAAWYSVCAVNNEVLKASKCRVPALPVRVAAHIASATNPSEPKDAHALDVVFVPGSASASAGHVWGWNAESGRLELKAAEKGAAADVQGLANQIVVIGNIDRDRLGNWNGPTLLAWAIGDAIEQKTTDKTQLLRNPLWAAGAALLFSALTLKIFGALRRRDVLSRYLALSGAIAVLSTLLMLACAILALRQGAQFAYYQVSYVVIGIVITALLVGHAAQRELIQRALYTNVTDDPSSDDPDYDVFISYSHSPHANIERVRRELVEPLRRLETAEGRQLKVFFDESSIRVGTSWYMALARGIERSRVFVAVYSSEYFSKRFCLFELRKAAVRDISKGGEGFRLLPFRRDADVEPLPEFSHLQYSTHAHPADMLQAIRAALAEQGIVAG